MKLGSSVLGTAALASLLPVLALACTTTTKVTKYVEGDGGDTTLPTETDDPDAGAPETPSTATKDGISLTIDSVTAALKLGPSTAAAGKELAILTITLANVSSKQPVAALYPLFTLATTDSLVVMPDIAAASGLDSPCSQNVSVDPGGEVKCALVFETKQGTAKELRYRLPSGETLATSAPDVTRCHSLAQLGKSGAIKTAQPPSYSFLVSPPSGTYVLTDVYSQSPGTFNAQTLKITGSSIERVLTSADGFAVQLVGTLGSGTSFFRVTYSCMSPIDPSVEGEEINGGYDEASKRLFVMNNVQGTSFTLVFAKRGA